MYNSIKQNKTLRKQYSQKLQDIDTKKLKKIYVNGNTPQIDLQFQCNPYQNPYCLYGKIWQVDS